MTRVQFGLVLVALGLAGACSAGGGRRGGGSPADRDGGRPVPPTDGATTTACSATTNGKLCSGATEIVCNGAELVSMRNCVDEGLTCASELGCVTCLPGRGSCDGNQPLVCRADGSGYDAGEPCGDGASCDAVTGTCEDLCAEAAETNSYLGCEYWPVVTSNSGVAPEFQFAVVVANPQAVDANVVVERGSFRQEFRVAPGGLETVPLPWIDALKGAAEGPARSAIVRDGAYHLTSSVPITVYQFNPLEYRVDGDCAREGLEELDGQCFSFTNDASLLLPTHVLTGNYLALAFPGQLSRVEYDIFGSIENIDNSNPGVVTIVGVDESVEVEVTSSAYVEASGDGAVAALTPGATATFQLDRGDVLQLVTRTLDAADCPADSPRDTQSDGFTSLTTTYCRMGRDDDFTGTEIRASGKVSVVSGHNCAFVPFNRWACDHLEEAMFPLESWGKDLLVSATEPLRGEPNLVRVVSGHDDNRITFDPASVHEPVTLGRGEVLEFETREDFRVTGSEALMVAQFLVGQDYEGMGTSGEGGQGDPSLSLAIPTEQYRSQYAFLSPESYERSFVNVTYRTGSEPRLDGTPLSAHGGLRGDARAIGSSGYERARVELPAGQHRIEGEEPFGIVVYGFGAYTSYMVPGGLDFEEINVPF